MKHQSVYNRLRRIEGQIRGIEQMVASEKKEEEILVQLQAAKSSLSSTIIELVKSAMSENENGVITLPQSTVASILNLLR